MNVIRFGLTVAVASLLTGVRGVQVSSSSLSATLDEKGTVIRLAMPDGHDFIVPGSKSPLFTLRLTREDAFTNSVHVNARQASSCAAEPIADGVRLVYGKIGAAVEKAVCTVRSRPGDVRLRWRLVVTPAPGWRLEQSNFPQMTVRTNWSGRPEREAIVGGSAKGGVCRNPTAAKVGPAVFWAHQPGSLVAQFVSFYDDRRLFYYGSEDGAGEPKAFAVERTGDGLFFNAHHWGWSSGATDYGFDFVTAALTGTAEQPCDWRDAADFYRAWALTQPWCAVRLADRRDLPAWMRDAPIMVRFYRQDFLDPARIRSWFHGYWLKEFPDTPLVAALWGWEHHGTWVSDYFPCQPSDEGFRAIVDDFRRHNAHAFPWPSGYHWTKMYGQREDGSFKYDGRARFDREIAPHAAVDRDGTVNDRNPGWLEKGHLSSLCPGDPWTFAWWRDDVCGGLSQRGCELVQFDQVCGGHYRDCWSKSHPHPPGNGLWKVKTFRRELVEMRETIRRNAGSAVVCYEEPNEIFNDLVGIQDYRDCEVKGEVASVFNYLYHEFVPCFQSVLYSRAGGHWYAHMAVDGQIPLFGNPLPDDAFADRPAMANGDFEVYSSELGSFPNWEAYAGKHHLDDQTRKSGVYALRMETAGPKETQQISRNITLDLESFRPGRTYRLSAWLKTERKGAGTMVNYGLYRPGFREHCGQGALAFPAPSEGWVRRESTFAMPNEGSLTLRFMINAGRGDTKVWIDDVRLEELAADGSAKPVRLSCRGWYHRFMTAWVKMYRGAGRAYLAYGRPVRPPQIRCGAETGPAKHPFVHHAAYVAADGSRAVFFANGTKETQAFEYRRPDGSWRKLSIRPDEILMERN